MKRFIDPPDMLSGTLQEWQEFLAEMKRIEPKDEDVHEAIRIAKSVIDGKNQPQT